MTAVAAKRSRIAQENEFVNSYATATYVNSIFKLTFRDKDYEFIDGLYNICEETNYGDVAVLEDFKINFFY